MQDNTACNECAESKFFFSEAEFACVSQCLPGKSSLGSDNICLFEYEP